MPGTIKTNGHSQLGELDASRLTITLAENLKPILPPASLNFGETKTDHMLIAHYDPVTGWSAPEIKPYGPLNIDPASSCLQYCTNVFEGMKAYLGSDGEARLFRPQKNMERLTRSAERVALPPFNEDALLTLIKKFVQVESRWIPKPSGYSLYIRPTIIGTRTALGVAASDSACLYVIVSPTGPYFKDGLKPISLLAVSDSVRSWPGGTGGHKLGLNYAPGFLPQRIGAKQGYDQILWLLGEDKKVTEVGAMNFFVVVKRDDDQGVDMITPPLDGTILPGLTRSSCLTLAEVHNSGELPLPGVPLSLHIHTFERVVTINELFKWSEEGKILEVFGVGTAVVVAPVGRIGYQGQEDMIFPVHEEGLGPIGMGLYNTIIGIQTGKLQFEDWSVVIFDRNDKSIQL